jgi:N-acetylneuraminic acid mutarotase
MRRRPLLNALLALSSFAFAACGDDTTEPNSTTEGNPPAPAFAVASNSWITRANMPSNRTDLAAATVTNAAGQSIVYAIGGLSPGGIPLATVTAYNVATNTWTFRRALPVALARSNGAAVINGKIYVSGGYSDYAGFFPRNSLYVYNPVTNTWTQKHAMPVGEDWWVGDRGATGVINGKLYVVTACLTAYDPWGYVEGCAPRFFRYNPGTDQWATLPSPSPLGTDAVSPLAGGVIGGKLYVMAGSRYTHDGRFAVYDPATNQWTAKTPLALARPGAATAVLGTKLYVMGGTRYNATTDAFDTLAVTIVYDPTTDAWTLRARMPSPRTAIAATRVLLNGQARIEVVGGIAPGNNVQYIP